MPLSEKGLEASCQGSYKHDLLDIDTQLEKEKAEQDELKRLRRVQAEHTGHVKDLVGEIASLRRAIAVR